MRKSIKAAGAALALAAAGLTTAAPAEARPWHGHRYHHYYHGGDRAGLAIGAGIVGLALGAAIASQPGPAYYDDYGYGYYPPPPPPPAYYYGPPPGYGYYGYWRCRGLRCY